MAYNPPIGSIYHLYTTCILPSGGLYATYHLLGEPETTIEMTVESPCGLQEAEELRAEVHEATGVFGGVPDAGGFRYVCFSLFGDFWLEQKC